jgi:ribosomal protein S18 acetylase RimI-like enzyme
MTAVTIRPAVASDFDFMVRMLSAASSWRPQAPIPDQAEIFAHHPSAHYIDGWPRPADFGVIAVVNEPVGAAWCRFFSADDPGYGYISDEVPELAIGVEPAWRGVGIGSSLLSEVVALAGTRRIPAVSLSVERDNPAIRLYHRLGFVECSKAGDSCTMLRHVSHD